MTPPPNKINLVNAKVVPQIETNRKIPNYWDARSVLLLVLGVSDFSHNPTLNIEKYII